MTYDEIQAKLNLIVEQQGPIAALRAASKLDVVAIARIGGAWSLRLWANRLLIQADPTQISQFPTRKEAKAEIKFRHSQGIRCDYFFLHDYHYVTYVH